jgi:hypothetical protein
MLEQRKIDEARRLTPEQRLLIASSFPTLPPLSTAGVPRSVS